jgi:hypothetical protein
MLDWFLNLSILNLASILMLDLSCLLLQEVILDFWMHRIDDEVLLAMNLYVYILWDGEMNGLCLERSNLSFKVTVIGSVPLWFQLVRF